MWKILLSSIVSMNVGFFELMTSMILKKCVKSNILIFLCNVHEEKVRKVEKHEEYYSNVIFSKIERAHLQRYCNHKYYFKTFAIYYF